MDDIVFLCASITMTLIFGTISVWQFLKIKDLKFALKRAVLDD